MSAFEDLRLSIQEERATVGVIGMGYVGLPLAHTLHRGGLPVLGFDIDRRKISALTEGRSYLSHLGSELFSDLARSERFSATDDFTRLGEADVVLVCVPTPIGKHLEPDLSYVENSARDCGRSLRAGQLFVLESTTFPGTTRDVFLVELMRAAGDRGLVQGQDYFVAYSPEREDPGRKDHSTSSIPKLVGGLDPGATELAAAVYRKGVSNVVPVESAEIAEAAKLLENIFRAVNIALVNELKVIFNAMGIDTWKVIDAAATKPFGFMRFDPGPGLGGHCIPIDPFYLTWKAKEVGKHTRFIELAGEINRAMPSYVVSRVQASLNRRDRAVKGARILVLGLAYKPDVDDTRESPSFELIDELRELGAHVDYSDPHVPRTVPVRRHDLGLESVPLTAETIQSYDVLLLATHHKAFDYGLLAANAKLVVDTRNAFGAWEGELGDRLVKA